MKFLTRAERCLLVILDGWGYSEKEEYNAPRQANTPNFDKLRKEHPYCLIGASGKMVGLPEGQMGNSEVGHLTLGSGRILDQPLVRINKSIRDGSFFHNPKIVNTMEECLIRGSTLHLLGLASPGGVHSHIDHLKALIRMALNKRIPRIRIHAITDGRDVPPRSAAGDIEDLLDWIRENNGQDRVKIATIMGRFYAMDRDKRWERTKKAFTCYVEEQENQSSDPVKYIRSSYDKDVTDEFIEPVQITDEEGNPNGLVKNNDIVVFFNFRSDRARQITKAFIYPFFSGFVRPRVVRPDFLAMMDYDESIFTHVAFPEQHVPDVLGEIISQKGLRQLRIAETEKYAHVTFFFNCGREEPFANENRILVPSPKVKTYDMKPEMSAFEVSERAVNEIKGKTFDLGVLNFANSDMVGHTGDLQAAIKAVEAVDKCLGDLVDAAQKNGYHLLITADHGNSETMWDFKNDSPHTAHTNNPVPLIYVSDEKKSGVSFREGDKGLADIAPTILKLMGIASPSAMKGVPLLSD
jgi:2,3-bisphosphoglycerate-independent phosphoglycerate mutase